LTEGGGVKCWGMNLYGQLGDGSTTNRSTPADVAGLSSGIKAIAAGDSHSCALTEAGGVKCWGNNFSGQLGDGSTATRLTPVDVVGLPGAVKAVATGRGHTCALTAAGGVKCWGANFGGQLGDGSTTNRVAPVDVVGLSSGIKAVATGRGHTCALTEAGGAKCWGDNFSGQLGDGSTTQRLTPVDVVGLSGGIKAIAGGILHTCALTEAGAVKCWGDNFYGQLGDGSTTTRLTPVDVVGLSGGIMATSVGNLHTCALTDAGGVSCWGDNFYGQLGDGSTTNRLMPVGVVGLSGGVMALSGGYHTCALTAAGGAKCWGDNVFGQLGDGTAGYRTYPMPVLVDDTASSPVFVSAKSRRVHGLAGTFDVLLNAVAASPTTEPRSGGAGGNHTIVFTFDKPVTGGVAGVTAGTATAGTPTFDGNEMIVPLTGVSNQQYVTVSVSDVIAADGGMGGSGSVRVGFLLGDVSQNRVVTVSDLGLVNAQIAQLVSPANFLKDVNASGALTVADKGIANTQITKALPAP
jgi:alpha-tubulin suppressor-like RCC1 family protein